MVSNLLYIFIDIEFSTDDSSISLYSRKAKKNH